jgi:AcrR family transcriptional regulator
MTSSGIDARRQAALKEGGAAYLARREEIVRAAATVFRQRGFESAKLLDVAKALGTDRASLYYYFASKEALMEEIVRTALMDVLEVAEGIKRSRANTRDKVTALIESMVRNYVQNYPHMSIYTEDLGRIARQDSEWATDVMDRTRRYEAVVRAVLARGQRDGTLNSEVPVDLLLLSLFGMINWMHRWYRPDHSSPGIGGAGPNEFSPEEIAGAIAKIFLDGAGTP